MSDTNVIRSIDGLVGALGGNDAVGRLLGIGKNGVSMWKVRGEIPRGVHLDLFLECGRRGLRIAPDLLELPRDAFDHIAFVKPSPRARARRSA